MILVTSSIVLLLVATAATSSEQLGETGVTGTRRLNCGGSFTADSSSLILSGGDSLLPGESCIWTIHLETTRSFRFTLTNYTDDSTDLDCSDAGIRIYSLTNLVPGDKLQSYTFCSAKPAPDSFFLNENIAAVVLYVSGNASVDQIKFDQFELAWEGSSFDPSEPKHVGSFSNSPSGVIRYPIVGQYESSLAATWAVSSDSSQNPIKLDFLLERLGLQSCTNPNPCFCDALILYTISESGTLEENQRFCSDSQEISLLGVDSKFILGFFTDSQAQSDTGTGFQVIYYPSEVATTNPTTTTTEVTSTTVDPGYTQCGEVFTSRFGNITYKENFKIDPNERCIWILRVPGAVRYDFSFITVDFVGQPADGIAILTLRRDSYPTDSFQQIRSPQKISMKGQVAVVMLFSDESIQNNGIFFTYEAILEGNDISEDSKDVFLTGFPTDTITHPALPDTVYSNLELSTFFIVPEFKQHPGSLINTTITVNGLDTSCECCDLVALQEFNNEGGSYWRYKGVLCADSPTLFIQHTDVILLMFVTDETASTVGGFDVSFVARVD